MPIPVYDLRDESLHTSLHRVFALQDSLRAVSERAGCGPRLDLFESRYFDPEWYEQEEIADRVEQVRRIAAKYQRKHPNRSVVVYIQHYGATAAASLS